MTDVTITPRGRSGSATHNKEIAMSDLAETADVVVAGGGSAPKAPPTRTGNRYG
jgi:hypothetical protein